MPNAGAAGTAVQAVLTASTFTFTYTQNGSNETGGGGTVTFGNPYYTFSTTSTATGAAINPITRTFAFADPNAAEATFADTRAAAAKVPAVFAGTGVRRGRPPASRPAAQ